jgi:3-phosphoglycerate kinase
MHILKDAEIQEGVRVLVRVDFNVPVKDGALVDTFRIEKALPTINFLLEKRAVVILVSHIENDEGETLLPVSEFLKQKGLPLTFVKESELTVIKEEVAKAQGGQIVLLENIRRFKEEKENDEKFAKELAQLADIYVNDAFAVSHRKHASVVGVPKFLPHYAGFLVEHEVTELSRAFNPPHPFLFILGGAKFETKEPLIKKFLEVADHVFVGGALGNDFFKVKGYEIGGSIVSGKMPEEEVVTNGKLLLPSDVVVRGSDGRRVLRAPTEILPNEIVSDAGSHTLEMLREHIMHAKLVLWNGPLGFYEKGYDHATKAVATMLAESSARSIVGGGDTIAAIESLGLTDRLSFISTGGGAMLDFLANGTLVGIEALK